MGSGMFGLQDDLCRLKNGAEGDRTLNLCIANAALSQLSYGPVASPRMYPIAVDLATEGRLEGEKKLRNNRLKFTNQKWLQYTGLT